MSRPEAVVHTEHGRIAVDRWDDGITRVRYIRKGRRIAEWYIELSPAQCERLANALKERAS